MTASSPGQRRLGDRDTPSSSQESDTKIHLLKYCPRPPQSTVRKQSAPISPLSVANDPNSQMAVRSRSLTHRQRTEDGRTPRATSCGQGGKQNEPQSACVRRLGTARTARAENHGARLWGVAPLRSPADPPNPDRRCTRSSPPASCPPCPHPPNRVDGPEALRSMPECAR